MGLYIIPGGSLRRLWAAALIQAYEDIIDPDSDKPGTRDVIQRKAIAWVTSTRSDTSSFISVCVYLGLNPVKVRKIILASRNARKAKHQKRARLLIEAAERGEARVLHAG